MPEISVVLPLPLVQTNTRSALLPSTARLSAPGPWMVTDLAKLIEPLVSTMVPVTAKSIVSPDAASMTACRRVPAPASARLVTVRVRGVRVGVDDGVCVPVRVAVRVAVSVRVAVDVPVPVAVGVSGGVSVGVWVGVSVAVCWVQAPHALA